MTGTPNPLRPSSDRAPQPAARALQARLLAVADLTPATRAAMYRLYRRYYEATSASRFFADLAGKDQLILLYDRQRQLRGFSTLQTFTEPYRGRRCRILYSGDTVIDHRHWGEQALAFRWIRHAGTVKAAEPDTPLYWLLIVKGHRTFRYLPAFARAYYPHWERPTPAPLQALMDRLGARLFGADYRPERGIVEFAVSRGQLRPEWAEPRPQSLARPEVRFFLQRNPGYRHGDELLCLTELAPDNLRPLARRLFAAGRQQ